jgi:HEAT repeat protein
MSDEELESYFPSQLRGKKLYNEVLIENIISLNKKMKGDFKDKLKSLYRRLELDKISEAKVKRKKWDSIVTGLVQINEMDLEEYLPLVRKQLYSTNFHVRSTATATYLNLSREVDLTFLKNLRYPLSNWQQMNYLRIIKYLYPTRELLMVGLLDSKNLTVRLFGYKLVRMVGRVDLVENLGSIAERASEEEKIEILKTIDAIGVMGYTSLINSSMKSPDQKLAIQAIKVAGSLGDKSSESIIIDLLNANPDFKMKMALLEGLKNIDNNSFEALVATSQDPEAKEIYNHLTDPLLSYV